MSSLFGHLPNELPILANGFAFSNTALTCYWEVNPEPDGLSRASQSSGKAFTLDCPRAKGIISAQVKAAKIVVLIDQCYHPLSCLGDRCPIVKTLSSPLFVLRHCLPIRFVRRC